MARNGTHYILSVLDSLNEEIIVICKDELRQGWEWWCASHQPCLMAVATVEPCTARKAAIIKLTIDKIACYVMMALSTVNYLPGINFSLPDCFSISFLFMSIFLN